MQLSPHPLTVQDRLASAWRGSSQPETSAAPTVVLTEADLALLIEALGLDRIGKAQAITFDTEEGSIRLVRVNASLAGDRPLTEAFTLAGLIDAITGPVPCYVVTPVAPRQTL